MKSRKTHGRRRVALGHRPAPETPRDWSDGDQCLAYHPRLHPSVALATIVEDFVDAPRRYYVKVVFDNGPRVA